MSDNIYRRKLLNAVVFFAKKIKRLDTTKILKLLYALDMQHFKELGYPSIGLRYYAFEQGPVPKEFWLEIKADKPPEDLNLCVSIHEEVWDELTGSIERLIKARRGVKPDMDVFSPFEVEILQKLAEIYKDANAGMFSQISHDTTPWKKTFHEKGARELIDYMLALEEDDATIDEETAREALIEHFSVAKNFNLEPVTTLHLSHR